MQLLLVSSVNSEICHPKTACLYLNTQKRYFVSSRYTLAFVRSVWISSVKIIQKSSWIHTFPPGKSPAIGAGSLWQPPWRKADTDHILSILSQLKWRTLGCLPAIFMMQTVSLRLSASSDSVLSERQWCQILPVFYLTFPISHTDWISMPTVGSSRKGSRLGHEIQGNIQPLFMPPE